MDPRHVRVVQFAAPTTTRSATTSSGGSGRCCPGWGGMTIFDRTWYGRVLVERVEGFATREEWMRAYGEIAEFERMLVARRGRS